MEREKKEIEIRLGSIQDGKFVSGVSEKFFEITIQRFQNFSPGWLLADKQWRESIDTFFLCDGDIIRQTAVTNIDTCEIELENIKKINKIHETYHLVQNADTVINPFLDTAALRFSTCGELHIPTKTLQIYVEPKHVRIKHRRIFIKEKRESGGFFAYHFTKVFSGKNHTDADKCLKINKAVYEIEIEFEGKDEPLDEIKAELIRKMEYLSDTARGALVE